VELPAFVRPLIEQERADQLARKASDSSWNDFDLVITRRDGTPVNPDTLSSGWYRLCRKQGLPHVRFHDLRHAHATLATFSSLCAWLGVDPSRFFTPIARRTQTPLDEAIEHLVTDPALGPEAAERIATMVRDLHRALARDVRPSVAPMALHLRAATVMRPGIPERLASLLTDMRAALEHALDK
jgi:hypothetical protein